MALSDSLKSLRDRLGLTLSEVSQKTGIGQSSLSEFENAKREPSLSQLERLAAAYEQPLTSFFEAALPSPKLLLWRNKPEPPEDERIRAKFDRLCTQYKNLEKWTGLASNHKFDELFCEAWPASYSQVEELAHDVWKKMALGERPGESLLRILEEVYTVKIFPLAITVEASSACTYSDLYGPSIMLNQNNRFWRRNFDLAHELFHLVTWRARATVEAETGAPTEQEESFANCFASRLLMPDEPFRDAIEAVMASDGKLSYDDLDSVARQFGVSLDALFWRLHSLYKLRGDVKAMIEEAKTFSRLPPRSDDVPPELPRRYCALAVRALRHGEMSSAKFADYVGINVSDVDDYTNTHVPEPVQVPVSNP